MDDDYELWIFFMINAVEILIISSRLKSNECARFKILKKMKEMTTWQVQGSVILLNEWHSYKISHQQRLVQANLEALKF